MSISNPAVTINNGFTKSYKKNKLGFVTLFINLSLNSNNDLLMFSSYNEALTSDLLSNNKDLNISIKTYFENDGDQLYVLNYNCDNFNLLDFDKFIKTNCDNLTELEVIAIPTLLTSCKFSIIDSVKILSVIGKYANESSRIFITDVNKEIIENYLDVLEESVIYYPWFKNNNGQKIAPSVVASALMSKIAKDDKFFHSIANKKIVSLDNLELLLSKEEILNIQKDYINPIIYIHNEGLKIWGVNAFNSNFNSINELRVIKYIKRNLKILIRENLFEISSENLRDKIFSKVNNFLYKLWEIGALAGESKDEAFIIESQFDETKDSDNKLVFSISVSLSKPLEFINIKIERIQRDGMVDIISVEV